MFVYSFIDSYICCPDPHCRGRMACRRGCRSCSGRSTPGPAAINVICTITISSSSSKSSKSSSSSSNKDVTINHISIIISSTIIVLLLVLLLSHHYCYIASVLLNADGPR